MNELTPLDRASNSRVREILRNALGLPREEEWPGLQVEPKHLNSNIIEAAKAGDAESVAYLLAQDKTLVESVDEEVFCSFLGRICSNGVWHLATLTSFASPFVWERISMLKRDNFILKRRLLSISGLTALHNASIYGQLEVVRILVAAGADINHEDEKDLLFVMSNNSESDDSAGFRRKLCGG
jgi:hypothetical protein